jgi:uncharacterized protein (DUF1330 family)
MAAYLIADVEVTDAQAFQDYRPDTAAAQGLTRDPVRRRGRGGASAGALEKT